MRSLTNKQALERAKRIKQNWPKWKQEYKLTKWIKTNDT